MRVSVRWIQGPDVDSTDRHVCNIAMGMVDSTNRQYAQTAIIIGDRLACHVCECVCVCVCVCVCLCVCVRERERV